MQYTMYVLVQDLTDEAAARVVKLLKQKTGAAPHEGCPPEHHHPGRGRDRWVETNFPFAGSRAQAKAKLAGVLKELEQAVGYETRMEARATPPPHEEVAIHHIPSDWCRGCGKSAAALGTTLDANGYHRGCRWAGAS